MTEQQEDYIHLSVCINQLNHAWKTLNLVKNTKDNPLSGPAFCYGLIEYTRAYTTSRGTIKRKRKLDPKWIPSEYLALHNRIIDARDKIHAHSDLTTLEASLHIDRADNTKPISMIQNNISGLEELENIEDIIHLIEETLNKLYMEQELLEASLKF